MDVFPLKKYLKVHKEKGMYIKCVIRKNERYGRGKACTPEDAEKIIASGAELVFRVRIGDSEYLTYEFEG